MDLNIGDLGYLANYNVTNQPNLLRLSKALKIQSSPTIAGSYGFHLMRYTCHLLRPVRSYTIVTCFMLLGMLACAPVLNNSKGSIFRYIDIGNNYRLVLGDKIDKHLAILEPMGGGYKLPGEGYGDAKNIFVHVSKEGKIERFQFLYGVEISKQAKVDDYRSVFGAPLTKHGASIWRDTITELQVTGLKDGALAIYLIDISEK